MSKYRNKKIIVDNITFASYAEFGRYRYLKMLEKIGEIKNLTLQPKFDFTLPNVKKKLFTYIADFEYTDKNNNHTIEDVKGFKTPLYRLKKKLIEAQYNIKITEITRGK
jgi:hypothetical protein